MLEDRDYMRQPEFGEERWRPNFRFRWSWTLGLLLANAVVFIVEIIFLGYPLDLSKDKYFALSLDGIAHGYVWQFVTFQFMHASVLHILFNSWTIFAFGRHLEAELGARRFLALYFSAGIIGGVLEMAGAFATASFWPGHFGTGVVGASAGAMGLMTAFAMLYPDQKLMMFFYFIPIATKAKYIVWGFAALSVLCIVFPNSIFTQVLGGNVANAAHLGGMAVGWFYVRKILNRALLGVESEEGFLQPKPAKAVAMSSEREEEPDGDVDAILDKISARGINSLTARERAVLEAARKKMARR